MGDDGFHLHALGASDSFFVFVTLRDCAATLCRGRGVFVSYANLAQFYGCYFNGNSLNGARAENSEVAFFSCAFENNCTSDNSPGNLATLDGILDGQATIQSCSMSRFDGCHFEDFSSDPDTQHGILGHPVNKRAIAFLGSRAPIVAGCGFFNGAETANDDERGVYCTYGSNSAGGKGVVAAAILPNTFDKVLNAVEVDAGHAGTDGTMAALDCAVFPQKVASGTGAMRLPTLLSDSGLVVLGYRRLAAGQDPEIMRGLRVPAREHDAQVPFYPDLTTNEAGYMLYDQTNGTLRIWDGVGWRRVAFVP
jgi:hypothetical protein